MRLFGFAFCAAIAAGGCALRPLQATIRIAPDAVHPVHQQVTALQRDLRIASACSNPESFETFPAGPLSTDDRVLEALASRFATASPGLCACFAETNDAAVHVSVTSSPKMPRGLLIAVWQPTAPTCATSRHTQHLWMCT